MKINQEEEARTLREVQTASETVFDGIILHVKRDPLKRFVEHPAWEDETMPGEFTAVAIK